MECNQIKLKQNYNNNFRKRFWRGCGEWECSKALLYCKASATDFKTEEERQTHNRRSSTLQTVVFQYSV